MEKIKVIQVSLNRLLTKKTDKAAKQFVAFIWDLSDCSPADTDLGSN